MKTLIVVESPAKAKKIATYLSSDYIIKATFGHVFDLKSGFGQLGVEIDNGFRPIYDIIPDKKDKLKMIIAAAKNVDEILLASDPDREGEAISFSIAEALARTNKQIKRIKFHEITKKAVLNAIANPVDLDLRLYDAQQARRVLDRIVGFSVSPFIIKKYGPKLSAGRVQSVAVRLVVDREREIESFVPEEYWSITASLVKEKTKDEFIAKYANKVTTADVANKIKKDLDNDSFKVKNVD